MMAEAQHFVLQDEITCPVCLDTLTDPVTLHCGHSFCLKCLTDHWDQSQECICPQCRHFFIPRPELHRNNILDEVIKKLKKTEISPPPAGPGDVKCDVCTGKKFRAVKSCLTCTLSFCQTHLWPHCNQDALKDHKLINPDGHLMKKLCTKDQKCLEFFCKSDETCNCEVCASTRHRVHKSVNLEKAETRKQNPVGVIVTRIQKRFWESEMKMQEMKETVELIKVSADKEVQESEESFTNLIC
ncbi:E3 ubiquitin/ISG15 ligase TRIM25-like isoform X1 [Polypterus senegalus]|uniref:E3 ubiquitin/ISG15 ligase TRIM25-like isoform X1 n=1 Tax=Polypterus senegalus TaxID=55291 RepID=UPI001966B116|nr:E3 ubiquitin/ISG15 ligase TRIM25-like isoform X1 [Polypterus senegalus]